MVDIHDVLADHRPRKEGQSDFYGKKEVQLASTSEIPDIFFDEILVDYKLNRLEILILMYLYRRVWCRPNLYREYGIGQLLSHGKMGEKLKIGGDAIYHALRTLEQLGFISTIRSGQYFVRRYFTKDNDERFGQTYDDFDF